MSNDASLLREFAQTGAESAFAELVRQDIDLVHSAAIRQVAGDAHRAEVITQERVGGLVLAPGFFPLSDYGKAA